VVAFLCTRVSCSTEQDWGKLIHLLQYLNGMLDMPFIVGADNLKSLKSWVDAVYTVHNDMKSHTGGGVSLGRGVLMCKSSKQKLNTKSLMEAEVVGASDYLPNTIWAKMFLASQGYVLLENIFAQDNQSAMHLKQNSWASTGQKSCHIDIQYFFIKEHVQTEGISIEHCPTDEMLADFFSKPLQGNLFWHFHDMLLSYAYIDSLKRVWSAPSEECVEDSFLKITRWYGVDGQANASQASHSKKANPFGASSHSFQLIPS